MAIPGYQSVMLPLLRFAGDEKEHTIGEAVDALALQFNLTDDDRKELLSSGVQTKFDNRVGWAKTFLKKARLLESTGRGAFLITQRGLELLKSNPPEISAKSLKKFPEFAEFVNLSSQGNRHDGEETLMIDHGIGVTEISTYAVKKMDLDYFGDE